MLELSKSAQVALALAVPTSVVIAYWIFSRWSSDEQYYGKRVVTTSNTKIKVIIPRKAVGTIIGKQGSTIKQIQAETGARLNFNNRTDEDDGGPRVLMIQGPPEMAQKAEMMVYQVIADMPEILKEEIQVPQYCIGRIIGKGGVVVRDIRRASGARIDVDKNQAGPTSQGTKPITLTGSRKQIDVAMDLIDEIVKETDSEKKTDKKNNHNETTDLPKQDENLSAQRKDSPFVSRDDRTTRQTSKSVRATAVPVEEDDHWDDDFLEDEDMITTIVRGPEVKDPQTDSFFQVMVSAVSHPGHFWVQMVGPKSLHLEQMQKDMSQQLESERMRQDLSVTSPLPGDMVAAKFDNDDPVFYRARVLGRTEEGKVDLYFVDYGDNCYADVNSIYRLRPEFEPFPHQAVQCQMAGLEPLDNSGWTEEGITLFEDLVHVAEWKTLYAKTLTYVRVQGHQGQGDEGQDTLRPCLQLFDTTEEKDVDIAEEMVARGHAKRVPIVNNLEQANAS